MRTSLLTCTPSMCDRQADADLIISQIGFCRAYIEEARFASKRENYEYAEVAQLIAVNAYATAVRFSDSLLANSVPSLVRQIERLALDLYDLSESVQPRLRSIA